MRGDLLNGTKHLLDFSISKDNLLKGKYTDFMYDHGHYSDYLLRIPWVRKKLSPLKTILLYRNPLDQMVSWYHYWYKNGRDGLSKNRSFGELSVILINDFERHYKRTLQLNKYLGSKSLMISYEELIKWPQETSHRILQFLELPIQPELLKKCIDASSKDQLKQEEKAKGRVIHTSTNTSKSFIRSGKIGEWRNTINQQQYTLIKEKLAKKNIQLEHFDIGDPV